MSRVLQREEEQDFHDRVASLGLVQPADLEACQAQQKKSMKKAVVQSLPDLLVERGFLSLYQVKKLLEGLETTRLYCLSCRKRFEVSREDFESKSKLACKHCGEELPRGKSSGAMAEDLVLDHPTHLGNKLLAKILVANKILGKKDLEKCQEEARERGANAELGRVLVEKNLLSLNKLKIVLKERDRSLDKHHPSLEKLRKDVKLARLLVKKDLVPVSRINECLLEQAKIEKDDKKADVPRLRDLLVERGFLTTYQIEVVIPKLSDKVLPGFESRPELFERSAALDESDDSEPTESSQLLVAAANPRQAAEADEEAFEDSVDALLDDDSSELDEILDDSSDFEDASSEADDLDESEEVDLDASRDDGASDDFDLDESESGPDESVEEPVRPGASSIADPLAASESFVPDAVATSVASLESSVSSSLGEAPPEIELPDAPSGDLDDSSLDEDSADDAPAPAGRKAVVKDEPIDIDDEELFEAEDSLFEVEDTLADSSADSGSSAPAPPPAKRPAPRSEDDDEEDDDFEDDFDDDEDDEEESRGTKKAPAVAEASSDSGDSAPDEKPAPRSATARRRAARPATEKKKGLFGMFGGKKAKAEADKETEELPSRRAARKGKDKDKAKGASEDKPAAKRSPTRRTKR